MGACLSLSGRFARFGRQAAAGLETWRSLTGGADLIIEDDGSDRRQLEAVLPDVASRCDLLLGPYSTVLMRAAGQLAAEQDWLIWNQGGSGDDVETAHPGHVVSVLSPTSRYGEPFLRFVAGDQRHLVVVRGAGSFGRQVADGAMAMVGQLGIQAACITPDDSLAHQGEWDLFSAGVFEDDVNLVARARQLPTPPRHVCAVAAGVSDFARVVDDPEGTFGIAQWFPGGNTHVELGPSENSFLEAYAQRAGSQPDYPAVQTAAGAALAVRCAELAGSTERSDLWAAATSLETSTLFGPFGVDRGNGSQVKHATALVRWERGKLVRSPSR
jgi:ABC-type branched-subunit amino acid transport system substrate-binding protein